MFHVELRQFPHQTRSFNMTREELDDRIVGPWLAREPIELDEYKWLPDRATLTIYEDRCSRCPRWGWAAGGRT